MIKILETKLISQKDKNMLMWKNIDDNIYNKYNQYIPNIDNNIKINTENLKINNIPTLTDKDTKNEIISIVTDAKSTNIELKNMPKVLNVIPVKNTANIPKETNETKGSKEELKVIKKSK